MHAELSPLFLMSMISFFPVLPHDTQIPPVILALLFKTPHKPEVHVQCWLNIRVSVRQMLTINYRIAHAVVTPRPLTSQEEKVCVCERPRRRGSFSNPANTERGLPAIESAVTDKVYNK